MELEVKHLVGQVKGYVNKILESLANVSEDENDTCVSFVALAQLLEGLEKIVPSDILKKYIEFFNQYIAFTKQCSCLEFLMNNIDTAKESTELLYECLTEIEAVYARKKRCACCGIDKGYNALPTYYDEQKALHAVEPHISETLNHEQYTCKACGANDRDRMIVEFLKLVELPYVKKNTKMLQFAPSIAIENWIRSNCPNVIYHSTDLYMSNVTFKSDIQELSMIEDGTYDYWICSHVLEHVQDDQKAMRELGRILKPDGVGIFLVPVSLDMEEIDEEWGLSEQENWRRFGQGDHCRRYGKNGLMKRLEQNGFFVHSFDISIFGEELFYKNALSETSTLYILSKTEPDTDKLIEYIKVKNALTEDEKPLVSVIMSCYNHEKYVQEAIESVINQTYSNIEFIVGDDGSSDGTAEIMKRYSRHFAQEYYFEKNVGGLGRFLTSKASGKYIARMNSDDIWELDKIEKQVKFMERNEGYKACFTWCDYVDADGEYLEDNIFIRGNRSQYSWMRYFWEYGNCLCHPSLLMDRQLYEQLGGETRNAYRQLPDYAKWIKLVQKERIYIVQDSLIKMRRHSSKNTINVSAATQENVYRHLNENMYLWYKNIRDMDCDFFKKSFGDKFVRTAAVNEIEITCEKYFLLLRSADIYMRLAAMLLYFEYDTNDEIMDCFDNVYKYTKKDFFELSAVAGLPIWMAENAHLREQNEQLMEKAKQEKQN